MLFTIERRRECAGFLETLVNSIVEGVCGVFETLVNSVVDHLHFDPDPAWI